MYVGVTRAADLLYMTLARRRMFLGRFANTGSNFSNNQTTPSRFLKEISPDLLIGFYPHPEAEFTGWEEAKSRVMGRNESEARQQNRKEPYANTGQIKNKETGTGSRSGIPDHGKQDLDKKQHFAAQLYVPLKVGELVQHNKFGIGQVVQIIGEKNKELYNVDFKEAGKRLLDPRFAKLIKIS